MTEYVLAVFEQALSDDDLQDMRDLCPGLTIERANAHDSEAISRGCFGDWQGRGFNFAFRLMVDVGKLPLLFIRYTPRYVGLLTSEDEKRCIAIAEFCHRFDDYNQKIHQMHAEFEEDYEEFFQLLHPGKSLSILDLEEPTEMFMQAVVDGKNELSDFYKSKRIQLTDQTNITP
ncbi:hypothetical protein KIH24_15255 [Rhizobiales bacterium TNE-4]|nr:hypothetical protein [Rhizobiales bacterium TNE-4]MBV1828981.1 hypothetical protein [Rhizobiales bacterium TNE-4]